MQDAPVQLHSKPIPLEYNRATKALTIWSAKFDTTKANVVVISERDKGAVARYQTAENLTFERHGRPPPTHWLLRFRLEIEANVRTLLERSPDLRNHLPGGPSAAPTSP